MSEEKPRKQTKSTLHQEESEFNPSGKMSMELLFKIVLNLPEEVKKLKKDNEKLIQQLNLAEGIESRLMSQEREISVFLSVSQSQNSQSQNQPQKQTEMNNRLGKIEENVNFQERVKRNWSYTNENRSLKKQTQKKNNQKSKINVSTVEAFDVFIGSVGNVNRNKQIIGQKNKKIRKKKKARMKKMYCNPDGTIYKIKMEPFQVKGRKNWRNLGSHSLQNWTTQTFIFISREHELLFF